MTLAVSIAALCALGVMVLSFGVYRLNQRAVTARRVANLMGGAPVGRLPTTGMPARWQSEVRHLLAKLEIYDRALRTPAALLACVCVLIGLASVSPGWLVLAVACAVAAYALGARERRRRRIEAQALEALGLLSSGLRAGYSIAQAIDLVAKHSPEPTASEFGLAGQEVAVGIQLHDAVMRLAHRSGNKDYQLVAIIIRVQHEVGGNLAQILDSVSGTVRERFELRRQVESLTAQQRLSSLVLTVLPFGLLLFLYVMDRSFVDPLFADTLGRVVLAVAGVMVFLGWSIMRRIGRVEV